MASLLARHAPFQSCYSPAAPHVAGARALLRPQPLLRRCRGLAAGSTTASVKAPTNTIKITIQGRRLPVTPAIKEYVEDKISKAVHNFAHTLKKVDVTLSARGGDTGTKGDKQQKVDVTIHTLRYGVVRVEDAEASLYASIDVVCDKVSRKLRKLKERAITKGTWSGRAGPRVDTSESDFQEYMRDLIVETVSFDEGASQAAEMQVAEAAAELPSSVMRSKVLKLDYSMRVDDAIDAMEAVGHDFYIFREEGSDAIQVVYKRDSGGYGVIIPHKA